MGREEEISLIAYRIWEEEGCCHGRDVEQWIKAEAIWEKKQKKDSLSTEIKTESKHITGQGKKSRPGSKRH